MNEASFKVAMRGERYGVWVWVCVWVLVEESVLGRHDESLL